MENEVQNKSLTIFGGIQITGRNFYGNNWISV